jgi:hypothetical protein
MKQVQWLMVFALSACGPLVVSGTSDSGPNDVAATVDVASPSDAPVIDTAVIDAAVIDAGVCLATGASCIGAGARCCTGYCDYQPYGYGAARGRCVTPRPDGEYCEEDRFCASRRCSDEICRARTCVAPSERCYSDATCCVGFCSYDGSSYAPGRCTRALPAGQPCEGSRWCASGRCIDSICAP